MTIPGTGGVWAGAPPKSQTEEPKAHQEMTDPVQIDSNSKSQNEMM
jgi:hypothetical protein